MQQKRLKKKWRVDQYKKLHEARVVQLNQLVRVARLMAGAFVELLIDTTCNLI